MKSITLKNSFSFNSIILTMALATIGYSQVSLSLEDVDNSKRNIINDRELIFLIIDDVTQSIKYQNPYMFLDKLSQNYKEENIVYGKDSVKNLLNDLFYQSQYRIVERPFEHLSTTWDFNLRISDLSITPNEAIAECVITFQKLYEHEISNSRPENFYNGACRINFKREKSRWYIDETEYFWTFLNNYLVMISESRIPKTTESRSLR